MAKRKSKIGAAIRGIMDSDWFLPTMLGIGAFLLISGDANAGGNNNNSNMQSGGGSSSGGGYLPGGGGSSGGGGNTTLPYNAANVQYNTALSSANADTRKYAQYQFNNLRAYLLQNPKPAIWWSGGTMPAALVVDGAIGPLSISALKHLWAWSWNSVSSAKISPSSVTGDVTALTLTQLGELFNNVMNA